MKKIPSLFKRDYEGTRLVYEEVVPGTQWVFEGEGFATQKFDGEACLIQDGKLYTRHDRKLTKKAKKRLKKEAGFTPSVSDFKDAPKGWVTAEPEPDTNTGHWPGWVPVGDGPEHAPHREAMSTDLPDGTYELCGPKIQGNPEGFNRHILIPHGNVLLDVPRTFDDIKAYLAEADIEGIVWWRSSDPDCDKAKIKAKDFGIERS